MNINWTITHIKDKTVSYCMFSDVKRLVASIRSCGKVIFSVAKRTKTSLFIQVFSGETACADSFAVAHIPKGAEDLKYVKASSYNPFSGERSERSYLRLSPKQGMPELKRYLSAVLEQMGLGVENLDVEVSISNVHELTEQ